jgi:hypothetical protein
VIEISRMPEKSDRDLYWCEVDEEALMRLPFIRGSEDLSAPEPIPELAYTDRAAESWVKIRAYRRDMLREIDEHNRVIADAYNTGGGFPSAADREWVRSRGVSAEEFASLVDAIKRDTHISHLNPVPFARCGQLIVSRIDYTYEGGLAMHPLEPKSLFVSQASLVKLERELGPLDTCSVKHTNGEETGWLEIIPVRLAVGEVTDSHFMNHVDFDHLRVSEEAWAVLSSEFGSEIVTVKS